MQVNLSKSAGQLHAWKNNYNEIVHIMLLYIYLQIILELLCSCIKFFSQSAMNANIQFNKMATSCLGTGEVMCTSSPSVNNVSGGCVGNECAANEDKKARAQAEPYSSLIP